MPLKGRNQRSITKPNRIFMSDGLETEDPKFHGVDSTDEDQEEKVEEAPVSNPLNSTEAMLYNEAILTKIPEVLNYIVIPDNKLMIRFLKRPKMGLIELVKAKIITSESSGKEKAVMDDSAEAKFIPRAVVVKVGSTNVNTKDIEVGDIIDVPANINFAQYAAPLHKEQIDYGENFYIIPDTHYSFIWKTKGLPLELRVKTSLIPSTSLNPHDTMVKPLKPITGGEN